MLLNGLILAHTSPKILTIALLWLRFLVRLDQNFLRSIDITNYKRVLSRHKFHEFSRIFITVMISIIRANWCNSWQNYSWLSFYDFLNKYTWRELLAKLALKTPNLASKKIITRQIEYKMCTFDEQ